MKRVMRKDLKFVLNGIEACGIAKSAVTMANGASNCTLLVTSKREQQDGLTEIANCTARPFC